MLNEMNTKIPFAAAFLFSVFFVHSISRSRNCYAFDIKFYALPLEIYTIYDITKGVKNNTKKTMYAF